MVPFRFKVEGLVQKNKRNLFTTLFQFDPLLYSSPFTKFPTKHGDKRPVHVLCFQEQRREVPRRGPGDAPVAQAARERGLSVPSAPWGQIQQMVG